MTDTESNVLDVLDWRRRVNGIYEEVRSNRDLAGAHRFWSEERTALLSSHPASPVPTAERATFNANIAPYDERYRFVVPVQTAPPIRLEVPTGTDGIVVFERAGKVILGDLGSLDVWWLGSYGGGVFIPVKDALAGGKTYGGGRYVIDTAKGADLGGDLPSLVIDLNFAYNPSCAYDPAWACPLAPSGNVVTVDLPVGELTPSI